MAFEAKLKPGDTVEGTISKISVMLQAHTGAGVAPELLEVGSDFEETGCGCGSVSRDQDVILFTDLLRLGQCIQG